MSTRHRLSWNEIQQFQKDQLNTILELFEKHGRVAQLNMLGQNLTLICEPEIIHQLLLKHPHQLHRDPFTYRVFKRMVGEGVFIAEGEAWRKKRKLIQPIFHAAHIHDFTNTFVKQTQEMIARWPIGATIQVEAEMMGLALRIICQTMFGTKIDGLVPQISQLMHQITHQAEAQLRPPLPDWVPTFGMWHQRKAIQQLRQLLLGIIRTRQAEIESGATIEPDLLTMLLTARDEDGKPLSDFELLDECLTIFVAGHETTAVAMTWTWILLLQHPDILNRLKDEVNQLFGTDPVNYERVGELSYLAQVVKESMRLFPPAYGFGRTPTESFSIDGVDFNKGDVVIISSYGLHRQDEFFPDPLTFNPDRFHPDNPQLGKYSYLPFGAGSRTCVGNAFATLEMQVILATLIQSVDFTLIPGQTFEPEIQVTLRPKDGLKVQVKRKKVQPSTSHAPLAALSNLR
ncbi:MAG: cytochrome P450 [Anaerolineae bacterium]